MTRQDLVRTLMNAELEEHRNLPRGQARAVVNEILDSIADALRDEELVRFPARDFDLEAIRIR